jgi:hypothetical protein
MGQPSPLSLLQDHVGDCRVRVHGATQGSGFFAAPGRVVTCAHVAGSRPGSRVPVHWQGVRYEATVLTASPAPAGHGLWPYPDLAVLEVADPPPDHPCVWLDDMLPPVGTGLTAFGFSDVYEPGTPSERSAAFNRGGTQQLQTGKMVELVGGEVNKGLSGGPVLSHESGGVCAIVKATRLQNSTLGGLGTPVSALRLLDPDVYRALIRAHDAFHGADERWSKLSDLLAWPAGQPSTASGSLSPDESRQLLSAMARLPAEPGAMKAAFVAAAGEGACLPAGHRLLDLHDVFTELAARMPPDAGLLPYELAFAADLVRTVSPVAAGAESGAAVQQLRDRVLITSGRLGVGDGAQQRLAAGPAADGRPSIIGRIRHSMRDRRRYHVMVWRFRSAKDIVPAAKESEALPLHEAVERLAALLPEQIEIMGGVGSPGLIELILPEEALDEGFPELSLWPQFPWFSLGRKQHVVVRPLERHEEPSLHAAWAERWGQLDGTEVGEAVVCVCGRDDQHQAALGASFDSDPALAAVALAGSPRSAPVADAYKVAVASGVPMIVWQRSSPPCERSDGAPCGVPGRRACPGGAFFTEVCSELAGARRDELPERVTWLRNDARKPPTRDGHLGHHIVLLWDDPRRQIPRLPLAPAEEGRP